MAALRDGLACGGGERQGVGGMVAIEEVEEGGQEEFAGDGPEAEEDAEESCECGEDGEVGEVDADEAFWEEEL